MAKHHSEISSKRKDGKESYLISTLKIDQTSKGWTVPSEAEYMKILLIGGGGAGVPSSGLNRGAGGGGAGSYSSNDFCVTPGDTFNVTIGKGGTVDGNKDGEDSVLEYKCHHKVAQGGKAAIGTLGGKGGKGYHSNENGTDGKSTGEGGKPRTYRCYDMIYGNGGEGGIVVNSPVPPVDPSPPPNPTFLTNGDVKEKMEEMIKLINIKPQLIVPKGSPRNCCKPKPESCKPKEEKCRCIPNIVIPAPSAGGSPGIQGYCEIEFYSRHPLCCERKCHDIVQHITVKTSDVEYAINPEADTVIINTSNFEANLYLPKGLCAGDQLHVKLAYVQGLNANIYVETGGMFTLSAAMSEVVFLFNGCTWEVLDSKYNVSSLYPTTQECKATMVEEFGGSIYSGRIVSSQDGKFIALSQPLDSNGSVVGSQYIYERCDNCLKLVQKIVSEPGTNFVIPALDISGDGKTIVVSSYTISTGGVEILVYYMNECKYSLQARIPVPVGIDKIAGFGGWLNLTTSGNTLFVCSGDERTLIYKREGDVWNLADSFLSTTVGYYQAINSDGTVLAITNGSNLKVFRYQFGSWSEEYSIDLPNVILGLTPLDISSSGDTIVLGRSWLNETIVFQRDGGIWSIEQTLPFPGFSVSISADGNKIASSSIYDSSYSPGTMGITRIWARLNNIWVLESELHDNTIYPNEYTQAYDISLIESGAILFVSNYGLSFTPNTIAMPLIRMFK